MCDVSYTAAESTCRLIRNKFYRIAPSLSFLASRRVASGRVGANGNRQNRIYEYAYILYLHIIIIIIIIIISSYHRIIAYVLVARYVRCVCDERVYE